MVLSSGSWPKEQGPDMSFLREVAGRSLREGEKLGDPERAQRRAPSTPHREESVWDGLGHWSGCHLDSSRERYSRLFLTRQRPQRRPRTRWRVYVSWLTWEYLGVPWEKLEEGAGEREIWASFLRLLPPWPDSGWVQEDGWMASI